jgi:MFS family permease
MTAAFIKRVNGLFRPAIPADGQLRSTIFHLFMDMVWIGVLSGTVGAFISVYAARLGAPDQLVGMLNAAPAIMNIIFAIPAGSWMKSRRVSGIVFWSAALGRIFYLPLIFLPFFLAPEIQVWGIIILILLMSIPITVLNVSFNAMFAEVIPVHQRAYVGGGRNSILSITSLIFTLASGKLLSTMSFPLGYQVVFGIGFLGAVLSTFHLFRIRKISHSPAVPTIAGSTQPVSGTWAKLRSLDRRYFKVVLLLFFFHISQWLVIPLNPILAVHKLKLTDFQISLGGSLFSLVTFVVSFWAAGIINRMGNHKSSGYSMIGLGLYPLILSMATGADLYIVANLVGGIAWAVLVVALLNYLLDNTPEQNRSQYLSYYILASNGSILIGSLLGPYIATMVGYSPALAAFAVLRVLSGVAILIWG